MIETHVPRRSGGSTPHATDWLVGGGKMGALIRSMDWSRTALGSLESWPQSLRSAVSILLPSKAQIAMFWGPDLTTLYNDAYVPVLGSKHPWALGQPVREVWRELWDAGLKNLFEGVLRTGEAFWASNHPFFMERFGFVEETFFDISYDPVRDESGTIGGLFCIVSETTARFIGERRLRALRDLSALNTAEAKSAVEACRSAAQLLSANRLDLPFVMIYLLDPGEKNARLVAATGIEAGTATAPFLCAIESGATPDLWPLDAVLGSGRKVNLTDLPARFAHLPRNVWPEPPHTAVLLPLTEGRADRVVGVIIVGISPRRPLDAQYEAFLDLLASQLSTIVASARAYEEERRRAESLAELDRAKTVFFSNVSHEFRTPLTLMLGPLQDELRDTSICSTISRERLEVAHRNSVRLLKLVNTLLDFSRIEAGRIEANYEPTDLAGLTSDLASQFRSAIERAGLTLTVDCPALSEPVYVDHDMWEKVVLNLLSNAFKFTFDGEICVTLRPLAGRVELRISDTGVGISQADLPKLFQRFHRVKNVRCRTYEGTGIGLALVQELVQLHRGKVNVVSEEGRGTAFTVTIPTGKDHLPPDRVGSPCRLTSTALGARPFIEEANRWLPEPATGDGGYNDFRAADRHTPLTTSPAQTGSPEDLAHILVADDNADMRNYLRGLLAGTYRVTSVGDGQSAFDSALSEPPDLVLADVMMPGIDGFELLQRLRADERTRAVPVILISARAGEESRIEGLQVGADDYLVKPFNARELLARVGSHLQLARQRRETLDSLRSSEQRLRETNALLDQRVRELEAAYAQVRDARRATLNLMQDAVADKEALRASEAELRTHRDHLQELVEERTKEVVETHARLRQAERMAAIGTLAAGLGHDMGNLLVPVRVRLESLAAMNLPNEANKELSGLKSSADYLQKLASGLRLLAVDPARAGAHEPTELRDWWTEAVGVLRNTLPRGIALESHIPSDPCWTRMPKTALTQAVFNLVQNAGDAMKERGHGIVKVAVDPQEGTVHLAVSDNGPGMTEEVKRRCMEPFYTTKIRGLSTGLGLALVYGLVHDSGGTIELESILGVGTTFTLKLAAIKPPVSATTETCSKSALVDVADARMRAIVAAELQALRFDVHFDKDHVSSADLIVADHGKWNGNSKGRLLALTSKDKAPRTAIALGEKPKVQAVREAVRQISGELVAQ